MDESIVCRLDQTDIKFSIHFNIKFIINFNDIFVIKCNIEFIINFKINIKNIFLFIIKTNLQYNLQNIAMFFTCLRASTLILLLRQSRFIQTDSIVRCSAAWGVLNGLCLSLFKCLGGINKIGLFCASFQC